MLRDAPRKGLALQEGGFRGIAAPRTHAFYAGAFYELMCSLPTAIPRHWQLMQAEFKSPIQVCSALDREATDICSL